MDCTQPLSSTELRRHAVGYVAELLSTCQLRGAFTLEEADGLCHVVRQLNAFHTNDEERSQTELNDADDARAEHVTEHRTLCRSVWTHACDRLTLAQARGKLTLREAWSVYNAMQLCEDKGHEAAWLGTDTHTDTAGVSASNGETAVATPSDGTAA